MSKSNIDPAISAYMRANALKGHKMKPRSKEHYSLIGKKGAQKRWKKI